MKDRDINILYIDDELQNLQSFKASFRREFNIDITTSVKEAEEILSKKKIQIIFADQRMPGTTGVEFFESIREKFPDPIRILVTGYTDITSAIDAINKGEVFRFISKPWDHQYVLNAIAQAYEIYRTRVELRTRNQELSKAYEELDRFVYSASHDLRAPLMSILGIVQLTMIEDDISKQKEYLQMIKQSVHKLDTFIINIIDYYKNARGTPEIKSIQFATIIREVMDSIKFLPGYEKVDIQIAIDQPEEFFSDLLKIRIIFINLLTNAIKFVDDAKEVQKISVKINCDKSASYIEVKDNGIGIKEADLGNVFNMFYRGRAANTGSGIGLYIVREAVNKLGGTVKVSSAIGEGTTFTITIPMAKSNT